MLRRVIGTSLFAAVVGFCVSPANAIVTNWTVQSASSTLSLAGALSSGGTFLASVQGQGGPTVGLVTSYGGSISTDWTPASIEFLSANLDANPSGSWDPLPGGNTGTAPGDYGGKVDLGFLGGANLTVRDLAASLSSGVIATAGVYPGLQTFLDSIDVSILTATADYRGFGVVGGALGQGSLTDGIAGQSGSVVTAGSLTYDLLGNATLTIPVDFTFAAIVAGADTTTVGDDIGVFINLLGAINATAVVPEASSLVLLGLAGSVIGFVGYRRKVKANVA